MDQQQIRLNFLDEAEDCFHTIESALLDLSSTVAEPERLDLALRATHSVKGGAGMMGFLPLSNVAHRLEDFFKILRIRHHSTQITTEVETLLLLGLDSMRQISDLHRQGIEVEESWLKGNVEPIFIQLSQNLGELREEDEDLLFAQSEGIDAELLMFEEGLEPILDEFEVELTQLSSAELSSALVMTSEKLLIFGHMANLEPFIQLCESIQQEAIISSEENINSLAQEALTLWRRSHALVMRGSFDKLPSKVESHDLIGFNESVFDAEGFNFDFNEDDLSSLTNALDEAVNLEIVVSNDFPLTEEIALSDFDLFSEEKIESEDLEKLQDAFAQVSEPQKSLIPEPKTLQTSPKSGKLVRVPVEQLSQFNTLFGKLIIERNRLNLRLEQLKNFAQLMQRRMNQLEQSNKQLRNWYDHASTEGLLKEQSFTQIPTFVGVNVSNSLMADQTLAQFDALEMDRYSDLHLISQEQIETIVQLKEVSTDIDFGLEDINQVVQELNHTMRSLQKNVTRIQMRPFADLVRSFPRLIRDLNLQFGKKVNLKIEGESTLLDRTLIEALNNPLMHLIRNAFDHGIEDPQTRTMAGKLSEGNITISAINRGTQTIIKIKDDGAGIRLNKICDRLRSMGISDEEIKKMSESEIIDHIFQAGFSTSTKVTELSGRGVGMDVVRTNLEEIRGDIHAETKIGQGTTFTLKVPFSLSILRVMIVEIKGMVFAVPVNSVREMLHLKPEQGLTLEDLTYISWHEQTVPLAHLEQTLTFNRPSKPFEMPGNPVINQPTILLVGEGDDLGAIKIDRFWGEQEVTIRPINTHLPLTVGLISSMILGDGRVLPLIDPVQIFQESLKTKIRENKTDLISKDKNGEINSTKVNTILITDDSINVRRYLASTLEKAGYQVEQAKDGKEAVDKLLGGLSVQGVICDIEMPRLDGYGVLEEIKGKPEFQSLPIVMLTSRSNEKHRKLAFNLGASAYFSKPYNEQELLSKISELIGT
ncbi:signal transduction histidine kinase CheA [Geminocystis sp. NIES-3708]|uniref:hybrid sensor histidine kinase/response regulator n=1 Tax=Geminocystis sp. NIES-3708 TaxID=1615909 RepID=UPI0005FC414F|nr:response regulator [Geminocystis sp. NIES-3708]BAQ59896.1 signal transduction histidine kinase CheA [Geminocystis sp. NIES-3708]